MTVTFSLNHCDCLCATNTLNRGKNVFFSFSSENCNFVFICSPIFFRSLSLCKIMPTKTIQLVSFQIAGGCIQGILNELFTGVDECLRIKRIKILNYSSKWSIISILLINDLLFELRCIETNESRMVHSQRHTRIH